MKIKIIFKNKDYNLDKNKLLFVLSKLENKKLSNNLSEDKTINLLVKYKLFDEYFLANLNNI